MVSKRMQKIRAELRNLASRSMLVSHRMRAIGVYCEAGIEWKVEDVPARHKSAVCISEPREPDENEAFFTKDAKAVCDCQVRLHDNKPGFQIILESGLSYRVMSAEGKKGKRVYNVLVWLPGGSIVGSVEPSDAEWVDEVINLHDKIYELDALNVRHVNTDEADEKSETDKPDETSGKSGTSERELTERIRKALL